MLRVVAVVCAFGAFAVSPSVPRFNWTKEVGPSGAESIAGVTGRMRPGMFMSRGRRRLLSFRVKSAVQGQMASSGLYRISASGYTGLGLSSVDSIAVDPQNTSWLFVV